MNFFSIIQSTIYTYFKNTGTLLSGQFQSLFTHTVPCDSRQCSNYHSNHYNLLLSHCPCALFKVMDILLVSYSNTASGCWTHLPSACRHATSNKHVQWADRNWPVTTVTQTDLSIRTHVWHIYFWAYRKYVSVSIILSHFVEWLALLYSCLTMNDWLKKRKYQPSTLFSI